VVPPLPKRARVFRSYSLDDLALGESYQSSSKRSFSIREKVAAGRMRRFLQISNFPHLFLICNNPSPTADAVPPLPKRARVFRYRSDSTPTNMTRVFRFFPKQRCLQLGSNFSASQSALGSPTVNFPDAKTLF